MASEVEIIWILSGKSNQKKIADTEFVEIRQLITYWCRRKSRKEFIAWAKLIFILFTSFGVRRGVVNTALFFFNSCQN
jgi:hypothetical protein